MFFGVCAASHRPPALAASWYAERIGAGAYSCSPRNDNAVTVMSGGLDRRPVRDGTPAAIGKLPTLEEAGHRVGGRIGRMVLVRQPEQDVAHGVGVAGNASPCSARSRQVSRNCAIPRTSLRATASSIRMPARDASAVTRAVSVLLWHAEGTVTLTATAAVTARTGVEMEAMTAAAVAALTVYDMVKGLERGVRVEAVELLSKSGGRSGDWVRDAP